MGLREFDGTDSEYTEFVVNFLERVEIREFKVRK